MTVKDKKIIHLKNVSTIYEGEKTPAVFNINMSVNTGEFISIIGKNGAGKTTLLETINGILSYQRGTGRIFGKEINRNKSQIRKNIGYVVQNLDVDPLTPFLCKDIVMTGRVGKIGMFRFSTKEDWEIVWRCMGLVGMIDFANRPIGKLSGGELQKILLARALAQQPKILLLDEPFSNLDPSSKRQIETLLNRIHEKQKITILLVSHDLNFIPSRCKRLIVMDKGRIILDGKRERVFKTEIIKDIFENKEEVI